MAYVNNWNSVPVVPAPEPIPAVPLEELTPGTTVMVGDTPEVVYFADSNAKVYTNHGQRQHYQVKFKIDSPDAIPALRAESPETLAPNFHLPVGLTLGADPEVFMVDGRGVVLPAFAYLPPKPESAGKAKWPESQQVDVFYDGFQAEFTIPAITCLGYTTDYVRIGLQKVRDAGRKVDAAARLVLDGVLEIPYDMRRAVDPQHLQLGCAPSKNAYGEPPMSVPAPEDLEIRFAGSHMHFGLEKPNKFAKVSTAENVFFTDEVVVRTVRLLDAILGVALVSFGEGVQHPARRQYYGRAGEYRFKPNPPRLEYRVPDVNLIAHPATMNLLWELGRVVVRMGVVGMGFLWDASPEEVQGIINEYDVPKAREVLARNGNVLRAILVKSQRAQAAEWGAGPEWTTMGIRALEHGIGAVVRDPKDLDRNWWLDHPTQPPYDFKKPVQPEPTPDMWWYESYSRRHANWPTGRIWSSAAKLVEAGELV